MKNKFFTLAELVDISMRQFETDAKTCEYVKKTKEKMTANWSEKQILQQASTSGLRINRIRHNIYQIL